MDSTPLEQLYADCQAQIQTYRAGNAQEKSEGCVEIIRRAADYDDEALTLLLELAETLIRPRCLARRPDAADDLIQQALVKIWQRFQNRENPFTVSTFAAFYAYLNLTFRSVLWNFEHDEQRQPYLPLSVREDHPEHEQHYHVDFEELERREFIEELFVLLPDPWEREALRCRYLLGESHAEIQETLAKMNGKELPYREKFNTYKLVEKALLRLRGSPNAQHIFAKFEIS